MWTCVIYLLERNDETNQTKYVQYHPRSSQDHRVTKFLIFAATQNCPKWRSTSLLNYQGQAQPFDIHQPSYKIDIFLFLLFVFLNLLSCLEALKPWSERRPNYCARISLPWQSLGFLQYALARIFHPTFSLPTPYLIALLTFSLLRIALNFWFQKHPHRHYSPSPSRRLFRARQNISIRGLLQY